MKRKRIIIVLIVFLAIGFASVSTTLVINGLINLASNNDDFNIIFTSAKLNGNKRNDFIEPTKKQAITFETNILTDINEEAILDYEVTNTSRNYDGEVVIECALEDASEVGYKDYIHMDYSPKKMIVNAGKSDTGRITAKLIKASTINVNVKVTCTLTAIAKERTSLGEVYSGLDYLAYANENDFKNDFVYEKYGSWENYWDQHGAVCGEEMGASLNEGIALHDDEDTDEACLIFENEYERAYNEYLIEHNYLWRDLDKYSVASITFLDNKDVPEDAIMSWDASEAQNGSIMAYTLDENEDGMHELYIGQNGGVKANPNSAYLFSYFAYLTAINDLDNFDTSNVTDMSSMFYFCYDLLAVNLSSFDTAFVIDMHDMFIDCRSLTELDLRNFDTSNVTDMASMFYYCSSLTTLNLSGFDTSNVTNMSGMFYYCDSLTTLDLSSFDTTNVTKMSSMFYYCESLKNLDLSSFNTKNVTSINYMFRNCSNLLSLDISNFDFSEAKKWTIFSVFYDMPVDAVVKVKDKTVQDWILAFGSGVRPSAWTTDNVVIVTQEA